MAPEAGARLEWDAGRAVGRRSAIGAAHRDGRWCVAGSIEGHLPGFCRDFRVARAAWDHPVANDPVAGTGARRCRDASGCRGSAEGMRAGLSRLDELAETDNISEQTIARLRERYEGRAGALELQLGDERGHDRAAALREERRASAAVQAAQRDALHELGARRLASAETLREIERELDLEARSRET